MEGKLKKKLRPVRFRFINFTFCFCLFLLRAARKLKQGTINTKFKLKLNVSAGCLSG